MNPNHFVGHKILRDFVYHMYIRVVPNFYAFSIRCYHCYHYLYVGRNDTEWYIRVFLELKFVYQQMHFYLTYTILIIKIYIKTLFYSHSYMFRSVRTIIRESILRLAKVTFL